MCQISYYYIKKLPLPKHRSALDESIYSYTHLGTWNIHLRSLKIYYNILKIYNSKKLHKVFFSNLIKLINNINDQKSNPEEN
jgi:hypothetical protein